MAAERAAPERLVETSTPLLPDELVCGALDGRRYEPNELLERMLAERDDGRAE